jgi:hypothetical protein
MQNKRPKAALPTWQLNFYSVPADKENSKNPWGVISMNWQNYFVLSVTNLKTNEVIFKAQLRPSNNFQFEELIISKFKQFKLSDYDKKKLSLDMRKIILGHQLFETQEFQKICRNFKTKIDQLPDKKITLSTQGGGIYLFMNANFNSDKEISCHTSELPLPLIKAKKKPNIQLIYSPQNYSFLSDIPSLWSDSEIISLFELKDFKASA